MTRRAVRDRLNLSDNVTLLCRGCGKRIADVRPVDGAYYELAVDRILYGAVWSESMVPGSFENATHGIKDLANEDWYSIRCARCGHDHEGREATLYTLAVRHPGERRVMPAKSTGLPVREAIQADPELGGLEDLKW